MQQYILITPGSSHAECRHISMIFRCSSYCEEYKQFIKEDLAMWDCLTCVGELVYCHVGQVITVAV